MEVLSFYVSWSNWYEFLFRWSFRAFAITQNVVIIMLGLGIGAMAVRSLTIFMVEREVVSKYIYLEHGAMWSIGLFIFINVSSNIPSFTSNACNNFAIVPITLAFIHSIYKK